MKQVTKLLGLLTFISLAKATPRVGFGPGLQDWGYFDVREGAHMFYWLYYTVAPVARFDERPLVIWLEGGPGSSSSGYSNFMEIGPLDPYLNRRSSSWVKNYNVLFIDNPVGCGYSYVDEGVPLAKTDEEIAADLLVFIKQFYEKNPDFLKVPLHIFGESYGGKMAAVFAWELHKEIKAGNLDVKLSSIGLGNAWISPTDIEMAYGPMLLQMGYIDVDGHDRIMRASKFIKFLTDHKLYNAAGWLWFLPLVAVYREANFIDAQYILNPVPKSANMEERLSLLSTRPPSTVQTEEKLLDDEVPEYPEAAMARLMEGVVMETLGINQTWVFYNGEVQLNLTSAFMRPVVDTVAQILDETDIQVAVFNGQLDLTSATPGVVEWINKMKWSGQEEYRKAKRVSVAIDGYIEMYKRQYRNLAMYWVNRAGHRTPRDNPKAILQVLKDVAGY